MVDAHNNKKKVFLLFSTSFVVLLLCVTIYAYLTRNETSTDDAYTDGNVITIAAKVSGYAVQLAVDDNTPVKKGQLLLRIDPRDYEIARDQAQAQLKLAQAQRAAARIELQLAQNEYPAQLAKAKAQLRAAQAELADANALYRRQLHVDRRMISQQNLDTTRAQQQKAEQNVKALQAQLKIMEPVKHYIDARLIAVKQAAEQVEVAKKQAEQALLNLSNTFLIAPQDGVVTKRNVQLGTFVQVGTPLLALVTPERWITANFKESQIERMQPGNRVEIHIDAYPKLKLIGHVDSIQQGSGSRFSLFPAENATGNFVKIVQRVPVKLVIDHNTNAKQPLPSFPLGLSVVPTVELSRE